MDKVQNNNFTYYNASSSEIYTVCLDFVLYSDVCIRVWIHKENGSCRVTLTEKLITQF